MSSETDAERSEEPPPTDEEQVETEWHFWLLGALLVGGAILVIFGPESWPPVGFGLVAVAVLGWIVKTVVERSVD